MATKTKSKPPVPDRETRRRLWFAPIQVGCLAETIYSGIVGAGGTMAGGSMPGYAPTDRYGHPIPGAHRAFKLGEVE